MSERRTFPIKSPIILALMSGGFVWLVLDSFAFGILTAFATVFLIKRDRNDGQDDPLGGRKS